MSSAEIISTGSHGNAVIYHNSIMVDCGISFKAVKPYLNFIQVILLSHKHLDHLNIKTLKKIQLERPSIRVGACQWMMKYLKGIDNIDLYEPNEVYNYGPFTISPFHAQHNVPNCGYRINYNGYKTIHVTDVAHLEGIEAKGYDLYAIEHNYDADTLDDYIMEAKAKGEYTHLYESTSNHLSIQQAIEFIYANKKESSEVLKLHQSSSFY